MPQYRLYTVGSDGHFVGAENMECSDDQEAIQHAQNRVDGHDIELWEQGRFIKRFAPAKLLRTSPL
jgi:hypothetical protein